MSGLGQNPGSDSLPARWWNGWPAALVLLAAYLFMGLGASRRICATCDETAHMTSGYTYWRARTFYLLPQNGNLPMRLAALPVVLGHFDPPPAPPPWSASNEYFIGDHFFYHDSNDSDEMLFRGRCAIALLSLFTGLLVYYTSRKWFGPAAGVLSVGLFAFCPTMLSHGMLITSDAAVTLFFTAACLAWWKLLHRVTPWTLLASCLAFGGLVVSKFSFPLVLPMVGVMILIRLLGRQPWEVRFIKRFEVSAWWKQCLIVCGLAGVMVAATALTVWTFYDFRYSAYVTEPSAAYSRFGFGNWSDVLNSGHDPVMTSVVSFCRAHHLLPEGFLYGLISTMELAYQRFNFLAGHYSLSGWRRYFPFCFAVKMPIGLFVILALAIVAIVAGWGRGQDRGTWGRRVAGLLYRTTPLWTLILVYWASAIPSHINIGFRHMMPTLPATYIFAGAAAGWWGTRGRWPIFSRVATAAVWLSAAWFAGESIVIRPHYLSYFNELIGGPSQGYRYLVDSSLDWGQDLPSLRDYLQAHGLADDVSHHVYLLYFGVGDPLDPSHRIPAELLPGFATAGVRFDKVAPYHGGVYCISATLLQGIYNNPTGPWTRAMEKKYWAVKAVAEAVWGEESAATTKPKGRGRSSLRSSGDVESQCVAYDGLRAARLCAYLRHQEPIGNAGYSILIFRLSEEQVDAIFNGPPAEMLERGPFEP